MHANERIETTRYRKGAPAIEPGYDVVVVGARVAGASAAMLLARQGLRVLLVDRAPEPGTDTLSTHALMRAGVLQLDRWGLLDELRDAGTPPIRTTTIHYGDRAQLVEIKPKAGVDALFGPRRTVLDPLLVGAAERAGVDVRYGVSVRGLVRDGARIAGVEAEDREGRRFRVTARWVVGADGLRSVVARGVEAPITWQGSESGAFLYGYWTGVPVAGYEWFYRPGASAGMIPTNEGRVCVWAGTPTARFLGEMRGDLEGSYEALVAEAAPEAAEILAGAERVERVRGFPGVPGFLRRPWGPGWALVGDAGSFRDPISAHGITDALRDAELLARAITRAIRGDEAALAEYERLRDESSLRLARITDEIASYRWDLAEVEELLLAMAKAMSYELELLESLPVLETAAA